MISIVANSLLVFAIIISFLIVTVNERCIKWIASSFFTKLLAITTCLPSRVSTHSIFFMLGTIATTCAFLLLVLAFVTSDFSLRNVFLNSSTIGPLLYKIAGAWASHEGSILLYVTVLSIASSIYIRMANYPENIARLQIRILAFIQLLFLCFVYFTSNPFDSFKFRLSEGLGLNPVLQDEALSIHPPLLYLGYVFFVASYVDALLASLRPENSNIIIRNSLCFTTLALFFLTTGIGFGSWWAYRELGWGGYWFFDPVENISLMPWLAGIALFHSLLVAKHKAQLFTLRLQLYAILPFLLTLYGICFVRSGIISSVHSFAFSAERGMYLLAICLCLTGIISIVFIKNLRNNGLPYRTIKQSTKPLQNIIQISCILWLVGMVSLFVALIYPLYQSFFYQNEVAIDPEYFYQIFVPISVPLMGLASSIVYFSKKSSKFCLPTAICGMISISVFGIIYEHASNPGWVISFVIIVSVFLMAQMITLLIIRTNCFRQSIGTAKLSLVIGHFAFGLIGFSIAINICFSKEIQFIGGVRDSVSTDSMSAKLTSIRFSDGPNYYRQIAAFSVKDPHDNVVVLRPENRLYKVENSLSQEADIYSFLTHDLMSILSKINDHTIHAVIYYRPMVFFIWLAVFLVAGSFLLYAVYCYRHKNASTLTKPQRI